MITSRSVSSRCRPRRSTSPVEVGLATLSYAGIKEAWADNAATQLGL